MILLILSFLLFSAISHGADERYVKVVYVVPADARPLDSYRERLHFLMSGIRDFYSREMKKAGFTTPDGRGKTFSFETEADGLLKVYYIDHRPDGNYPDPTRVSDVYRANVGVAMGEDVHKYMPADFLNDAVIFHICHMSSINGDHDIIHAYNGGAGESGPGKRGHVYLMNHIFGNQTDFAMDYPPLNFHAIGRNRAEQLEIFRDPRFTNIKGYGPPFGGAVPSYWEEDEWPEYYNMRVWEYACQVWGIVAHEIGHAFALSHCMRMTPSNEEGFVGDYNVMGNGFRAMMTGIFPEEDFNQDALLPRVNSHINGFGTRAIINPLQTRSLNRNQFFNSGVAFFDYDRPVITGLSADYFPAGEKVEVYVSGRDAEGAGASGLSHVSFFLDWNIHAAAGIPKAAAFDEYSTRTALTLTPEELALSWYADGVFRDGLHTVTAILMDRDGNPSDAAYSSTFFSIGQWRIPLWLVWSEYFDAGEIVGGNDMSAMLEHDYFSRADEELRPGEDPGSGVHSWRRLETGDYLDIVGKLKRFFVNPPDWSYRRVCYAAVYLISDRDRELVLKCGYNDYVQIFLNGEELYRDPDASEYHDPFYPETYARAGASIKKGENLLVLKNYNEMHGGGFHVFFEEPGGKPVELVAYPPGDTTILSYSAGEHFTRAPGDFFILY